MNTLLGYLVLGLFLTAIVVMICAHIKMVEKDARKEEEEKAGLLAVILAEQKYNRMVQNTKFKIKQTVVISNESDIRW